MLYLVDALKCLFSALLFFGLIFGALYLAWIRGDIHLTPLQALLGGFLGCLILGTAPVWWAWLQGRPT